MLGQLRPPVHLIVRNKFLFKHGKILFYCSSRICLNGISRLTANYAPYPDGNVPRQGLYYSYRRVCDQYGIPHSNTATLGKAIRLCFPTIKTRRLGVRGNSKYHCVFINCLIAVPKAQPSLQIAAFARPPPQKPSGCRTTSESPTTMPHSNLSTPPASPVNKPKHRCEERSVLTKMKRRTRRMQAPVMPR